MSIIFLEDRPKVLRVDVNQCTSCQSCVMACSLKKEGVFSSFKSRINILSDESRCFNVPDICEHCEFPPCVPVCPTNAITKNNENGIVKIDMELCIGCGKCSEACPFDSIKIRNEKAYKCDLCNGDPECVKVCYAYALQYVEKQPATIREKERLADERIRSLKTVKGVD